MTKYFTKVYVVKIIKDSYLFKGKPYERFPLIIKNIN